MPIVTPFWKALGGPKNHWLIKKLELQQKSLFVFFCDGLHKLTINFWANTWAPLKPSAFQNDMTISITCGNFGIRAMSEGARPIPLKIFDETISFNSTFGECIIPN